MVAVRNVMAETIRAMEFATAGRCFSCGNDKALRFDVGGMSSDFKACDTCIARYGPKELAKEADRLLEVLTSPEWKRKFVPRVDPKCFHCGAPTFQNPDGTIPLMCSACWREYRNTFPEGTAPG